MTETNKAIERYEPASLSLAEQTLDQLAETILNEHAEVEHAAGSMLLHAIRTGEALNEAYSRVEPGQWAEWVEANVAIPSRVTPASSGRPSTRLTLNRIRDYRRLATHREAVLSSGAVSINQAAQLMADRGLHLPGGRPGGGGSDWRSPGEAVRQEALQLRAADVSVPEIAETLGVARGTVHRWVNPEANQRYKESLNRARKRRAAERRALREKEDRAARDEAAKRAGGDIAKAYSLIRQAAAAVDSAADQLGHYEARSLRAQLANLYKVEDEICRILRTP